MSRLRFSECRRDVGDTFRSQCGLLVMYDGERLGLNAPMMNCPIEGRSSGSIRGVSFGFCEYPALVASAMAELIATGSSLVW